MGIKESTGENKIESDKSLVHDLFDKINISKQKIKSIYRFNKKNESNYPAIIKVELNDADDKNYILKASKLLKSIENYKQVYINNNLTPAQRKIEIELIKARNTANDERSSEQKSKLYFSIRSGKVIPKFYKDDNFGNANKQQINIFEPEICRTLSILPKIENESVNIENSHNNSDIIDLDKTYDNLDLDFNELDENSQSDDINKINQNDNTGNNFLFENFNLNSSFVIHNN